MYKRLFALLAITMVISSCSAIAETSIQQIQSPIYTDDIGRAHFLGRGGYSSVRTIQMNQAQSEFVNDAVNNMSNKKNETNSKDYLGESEKNITDVINERTNIPVSSKTKSTFTTQESPMNPSALFDKDSTYMQTSGVNESKTIYKDDLGRLHFFGKGNLIKE